MISNQFSTTYYNLKYLKNQTAFKNWRNILRSLLNSLSHLIKKIQFKKFPFFPFRWTYIPRKLGKILSLILRNFQSNIYFLDDLGFWRRFGQS